jgi:hypothetical protein
MADVLLREPSPLAQRNAGLSPQSAIVSSYPANDPSPPLETTIHAIAVAIPIATFIWFLLAIWIVFGGGEASLVLAVITFLGLMYVSLIAGGGALARDVSIGRPLPRSFREFLDGEVEIATGRITGRQALMQIAVVPVTLTVGGTAILAVAAWARV